MYNRSQKHQHIRFGDDDENEEDTEVNQPQKSHESTKEEINIRIIKQPDEESFGFELKGAELKRGENFVDNVNVNSPAYRANLLVGDRVIKVNSYRVSQMNITELFSLLEYETGLNSQTLDLVVSRQNSSKRNIENEPNEQTTIREIEEMEEMAKKKQKKSQEPVKNPSMFVEPLKMSKIELENFVPASLLERTYTQTNAASPAAPTVNNINRVASPPPKQQPPQVFAEEEVWEEEYESEEKREAAAAAVKSQEQQRAEAIEQVKFSVQRITRRSNVPSRAMLNAKCGELQAMLSQQGKYVTWQELVYELLQRYEGCKNIGDLGYLQCDHLDAIAELLRVQRRIDTLIIACEFRMPFMALLDLEQLICGDYNYYMNNVASKQQQNSRTLKPETPTKVTKFTDLNVGPLLKNQLVRQIMRIPDDVTSIRQLKPIAGVDLCRHLVNYLRENELWSKKVKESEFEVYLLEKTKVKNAWMLGYRIANIGNLIGALKSIQHLYAESMREIRTQLGDEMKVTFENEKRWIVKQLNDRFSSVKDPSAQTSLKFLEVDSIDFVDGFIGLFKKMLNPEEFKFVEDFLLVLKESVYLRDCFQLAICLGKHELDPCLNDIESNMKLNVDGFLQKYRSLLRRLFFAYIDSVPRMSQGLIRGFFGRYLANNGLKLVTLGYTKFNGNDFDDDQDEAITIDSSSSEDDYLQSSPKNKETPSLVDCTSRLLDLVESKLEPNKPITFEHLAKLEGLIYGQASYKYAELLHTNRNVFEKRGIKVELNENTDKNTEKAKIIDDPLINEHLEQLKHGLGQFECFKDEAKKKSALERIVSDYYGVEFNSDCLGSNKRDSSLLVAYENALVFDVDDKKSKLSANEKRSRLLADISECPSLCELNEYLNWRVEYAPVLGGLKDYLVQNPVDVALYEIEPGKLLKVNSNSDIESLKASIESGDAVSASSHLVSIITVKYRGLASAPLALIANEIQSSLSVLLKNSTASSTQFEDRLNELYDMFVSKSAIDSDDEEVRPPRLIARFMGFVSLVIEKIPFRLATRILFPLILDPVVKLTSNHGFKKQLFEFVVIREMLYRPEMLNDVSKTIQSFIHLGQSCAIKEWSKESLKIIREILSSKAQEEIVAPKLSVDKNQDEKTNPVEMNQSNEITPIKQAIKPIQVAVVHPLNEKGQQFAHIQSIRQRYGIGVELDDQSRAVADSLKGVISRSLETLSNELYNKDMHFVLELIQNSDDNTYPEVGQIAPTLAFLIEPHKITLLNNELGFGAANINAICDVKASTKGKHARGYIGRKGIGFKSVFTVTNRPQIHSNGYHFEFCLEEKEKGSSLGYIMPNWIEINEEMRSDLEGKKAMAIEALNDDENKSVCDLETIIELPFKSHSEMQRHKSSLLTNNFNDIKPNILLFLNRLRNLVIINTESKSKLVYKRTDLDPTLVELSVIRTNSSGAVSKHHHKWLVARRTLQLPDNLKPSDDVDATDLCLAFPISDSNSTHIKQQQMDVFAFLPLRSFGFKFIIQADFVVPASRQDLNQDSPWNQWIVNHLPALFVQSLHLFREKFEPIEAVKAYLRFVPLEDEIVGFFHHIPRQVAELLRQEAFLPAVGANMEIVWHKPFECVLIKDDSAAIQEVLTSDLLQTYLGRYYLHPALLSPDEAHLKSLLIQLGVHQLDLSDIVDILKSALLSTTAANFDSATTAKWLVVLYHCFNSSNQYSMQQEELFLDQLKKLEFIPVIQFDYETKSHVKKLVSLSQQSVFLRPSESKKTTKTLNKDKIDTLIEQDLCLLDVDTLLCLDELKNAQIISVLTSHLSVRLTTSPSDIIEHHIMRQLDCSTTKPEEVLIGYAVYLSWYSQWNLIDSDRLRAKLPLKTSLGFKILSETSPIIITPIYGSRLDVQHLFPSYSKENRLCGFIDDIYMRKSAEMIKLSSAKLADIWHRFWVNLGLSDGLAPRLVQIQLDQVDLDAHKQFSQYKDRLLKLNDGEIYVFKDYQFDLIDFYVDYVKKHFDETLTISNRDIIKELTNLYRFIEENWNSANTNKNLEKKFNSCRSISVFKRDSASDDKLVSGEKLICDNLCESTFFAALKIEKWILAECNRYQVMHKTKVELITEIRAKRADEVFLKEHVFTQLYGLHVPYVLNAPYRDKSTLSVDLDFKSEFSMSEFVDTFESWTVSKWACCFTLDQMRHIYTFISNYTRSHSNYDPLVARLSDLSRSKPFIFIPMEREVGPGETRPLLGQFYSSNSAKLFWKDPSGLFAKYGNVDDTATETARFIGGVYSERMREVFVDEFELTETPPIADYVALLEHICFLADTGKSPFSSDETLSDVFILYECLVDKCVELSAQLADIDLAAPLKQQVSTSVLSHLQNMLSTKSIIACYQKNRLKWQSASQSNAPCLADAELDLAEKFSEKINIAVVNVASQQHIVETDDDDAFVKSCRFETDTMKPKLLFFWLEVLQLSSFSSLVILDLENITECLREAPVNIQNRCRRLVPLVQCFLASRADCRPIYERLKALDVKEKLEMLKIYSVKELQNIYRFKHESSIYCQVSNRTCLDVSSTNWKFYIRADVLESAKDVIRGFIRLFTRLDDLLMSESCAKDLLAFCMIMQQFDLSSSSSSDSPIRLNDEDRREIERDYRVKLVLPAGEVKWRLRDLQPEWTNNAMLEEGEIDEKDPMIMRANRPVRNQAYQANNGPSKREMLYELERISSNQMMLPPAYGPDNSNPIPHHQHHQNQYHNNQNYANMNRQNSYNNAQSGQSNLRGDLNNPSQSTQVSLRRASFVELPNKEETAANNVDTFDFDVRPKIAQSILDSLASMSRFNDMSQNDQQFLFMIGRWGEMWVNEALKSRYQSEIASNEIKIEWMNETAESGLPYDIRIINRKQKNSSEANFASSTSEMDSTANEDQVIAYIEVKSTRKTEQESFPISYQEILFAQKNQSKFEIYRVYGAGMNKTPTDEQPIRVKIFRNVPRLLNSHKLNLFIVI